MIEELSKKEQWESMIEFYQDLIERSGWPIDCMLDLIKKIIDSPLSKRYYPSSSHASLGFSVENRFEYRLKKPMIYILCDKKIKNFVVSYQHGQGNTKHTKLFPIHDETTMLNSVENWLENA